MRVAIYARVSTQRQAQTQTIEQQLARLLTLKSKTGSWSQSTSIETMATVVGV
jgi:DNA invertase Pin-like site-specific DNA recombinase